MPSLDFALFFADISLGAPARSGAAETEDVRSLLTDGEGPGTSAPAVVNREDAEASNRETRRSEARYDHGLIERAKRGEAQAFRELVERHQRRALALAIALVRDEQDAREVVQEAFLRVHRSLASFQGSSSFFTWLYRIITNLSIDLMRKPSRRETELDAYLEQGEEFAKKSKEIGHRAEMFLADGVGHGFFNRSPWQERTLLRADEFLVSIGYLSGKATIKAPE